MVILAALLAVVAVVVGLSFVLGPFLLVALLISASPPPPTRALGLGPCDRRRHRSRRRSLQAAP